ncbi:hypothetical protein ABPG72_001533 [Tetrahymena utriculariae]
MELQQNADEGQIPNRHLLENFTSKNIISNNSCSSLSTSATASTVTTNPINHEKIISQFHLSDPTLCQLIPFNQKMIHDQNQSNHLINIRQQLEQGSGSEIWEGRNSSRDCIFKMVKKNSNASTYTQLVNEYEILKKKIPNSHPNIVKIYDLYHNIGHPNEPEQPVVALSMKKYTYDGIRCLREFQNAVPMVKI